MNVRGCEFLNTALEEAQNEEKIIMIAENCGCCGECTLEDGCALYKNRVRFVETDEEQAFYRRLRKEFVGFMLGE